MIKPIPKRLLEDTIKINGTSYSYVRVEPTNKVVTTLYGEMVESDYLIFIDKVNTPDYETLKNLIDEDCVIEYQDKFRTVRNVDILKAFGEHHMEVYVK